MPSSLVPGYDRAESVTGRDLRINERGDIAVNTSGVEETAIGVQLINESLIRRLYTPTYGYRRWVRTAAGLEEVDVDYGNDAFYYLTQPNHSSLADDVADAVMQAARADQRIEALNITINPVFNSPNLELSMTYRIRSTGELAALNYILQTGVS